MLIPWDKLIGWLSKITNSRQLTLVISGLFLFVSYLNFTKLDKISTQLNSIPGTIVKNDSATRNQINKKLDAMYTDASVIFQGYTKQNANDLKSIIDNTNGTSVNFKLLKDLIDKTSEQTQQEIRKLQFNNRYRNDSFKFTTEPISLILKDSFYYARR